MNKSIIMTPQSEFILAVKPAADSISAVSNVTSIQLVAMWANESGWGKSSLAKKHKNYFGIVFKGQKGAYDSKIPHVEKGVHLNNFAGFYTVEEAFDIKRKLILSRYNPSKVLSDKEFGLFLISKSYCTSGCTLYYKFDQMTAAVRRFWPASTSSNINRATEGPPPISSALKGK